MLGITVADAVLISTLILAVLAAWRGAATGAKAAVEAAPEPVTSMLGAEVVDTRTLQQLTAAVTDLAVAIRGGIELAEKKQNDEMTRVIKLLVERLDRSP